MDISKFLPKPHPTRAIFKKHNIPLSAVSQYLDLTYNYVSSILRGAISATPDIDAKLQKLADELQKSGGTK